MEKFSVDFTGLQNNLQEKKVYRLSEVSHRIRKVAFDVVRFVDSDKIDDLWQIHRDGENEYIVAMYDETEAPDVKVKTAAVTNNWTAQAERSGDGISVFYRGNPVTRLTLASLGIEPTDASLVCEYLPRKIATDGSFRASLLNSLTEAERSALLLEDPAILGK